MAHADQARLRMVKALTLISEELASATYSATYADAHDGLGRELGQIRDRLDSCIRNEAVEYEKAVKEENTQGDRIVERGVKLMQEVEGRPRMALNHTNGGSPCSPSNSTN